jgi:nucleoside-diphosphate-sugar epimerase
MRSDSIVAAKSIVVGNGLIANALATLPESSVPVCYFASGVSNSSNRDPEEFNREYRLLKRKLQEIDGNALFVYFSSCSVYDTQSCSMYVNHKLHMESMVASSRNFIVFRLPQVVGMSKNKFTLTNYIRNSIVEGQAMKIQRNAVRSLIDIDDVATLAHAIVNSGLHDRCFVNVANPCPTRVTDLVGIFERILHRQAHFELSESGSSYFIDTTISEQYALANGISFSVHYAEDVISKYYSPE